MNPNSPNVALGDSGAKLRASLRVIRDHIRLILACALLTGAVALGYSLAQPEQYQATSKVLLTGVDVSEAIVEQGTSASFDDPEVRTATGLDLAKLPSVATQVVRELDLPEGPEKLLRSVDAEVKGNSRIIALTATDESPRRATAIANSFARQYVSFQRTSARARFTSALELVRGRLSQTDPSDPDAPAKVARLEDQANQLELLASLQTGGAEVVQPALMPSSPVSPKPVRSALLGGVFGLMLGLGLASLRERLDRRIKGEEQLKELLPDLPVVARVPEVDSGSATGFSEAFRTLQTNLSFLAAGRNLHSVLVTSPDAGAGKSTTSLNLALAMAERDERVLLVDADLRRPALTGLLGLGANAGVSNFLSSSEADIGGYVREVVVPGPGRAGVAPIPALAGRLMAMSSGPVPPNPQALLGAPSVGTLLTQARQMAEGVVIDGAPLGAISDMLPVAAQVDGVLVVLRLYQTGRDELDRLLERLEQISVEPLGIVLVGGDAGGSQYYETA